MTRRTRTVGLMLAAGLALTLGACAAGRGPAGEVVVGFDVASLPEDATQFGMSAAKLLPSPWGDLLAYGIGGAGLLAGAHYRARKKGEDAGWTDALGTPPQAPVYVGASGGAGYAVPAPAPVPSVVGTNASAPASTNASVGSLAVVARSGSGGSVVQG